MRRILKHVLKLITFETYVLYNTRHSGIFHMIKNKRPECVYTFIKNKMHKDINLPCLRDKKTRKYTIKGLSICFFTLNLDKIVRKEELIQYLAKYNVFSSDPQPRHLGLQHGFYFLIMGSYHPVFKRNLKQGEYCLRSLNKQHPSFQSHRTGDVNARTFMTLKKKYDSRCCHCGSQEGKPNYKNKLSITSLEKGHMHPRKPLSINNCIPICSVCNHVYKDHAVFNKRGFVSKWIA